MVAAIKQVFYEQPSGRPNCSNYEGRHVLLRLLVSNRPIWHSILFQTDNVKVQCAVQLHG